MKRKIKSVKSIFFDLDNIVDCSSYESKFKTMLTIRQTFVEHEIEILVIIIRIICSVFEL